MSTTVGRWGEDQASDYLRMHGFEILARNWRCPVREYPGELDMIALDGSTLVICEVKTRLGAGYGSAGEAVDARKARRVRRLAALWLSRQRDPFPDVRFDVISVGRSGGTTTIEHIRGAL